MNQPKTDAVVGHTPGPFVMRYERERYRIFGANGDRVLSISFEGVGSNPGRSKANADFVLAAMNALHERLSFKAGASQ